MAVITLSRELGSLGTEIADTLSSKLGYAKLDKKSLEALLKRLGMNEPQFERDDEKKPGFWEQLTLEKVRYLNFMKAAVYRFAGDGDCIILGRGANILLRDVPGTLKLRIVAPTRIRVARLCERLGIDEPHALRMIRQCDHDRAGYHKYFFDAAWDSCADYDLVANTSKITPGEVCDMVSALLRSPAYSETGELARRVLRDLHIAQDVFVAIAYRERIPVLSLEVTCDKGVVALDGAVRSDKAIGRCQEIAASVEGVTGIINRIAIAEYAYYPPI